MAYPLSDRVLLERYFSAIFDARLHQFIDHSLTLMCKRIMIDIATFDDYMIAKHAGDTTLSLAEIVQKHYGDEALALIDELL